LNSSFHPAVDALIVIPKKMRWQFQLDWQLFLAARSGDIEAARECLREDANPDFEEPPKKNKHPNQLRTPLSRSLGCGHRDTP
jgi:hypothetical protein